MVGRAAFEMYEEKVPRFASEYGVQGMPSMEAVKSMFSGKADLDLQNQVIKAHEKHARGWQIIDGYMTRYYTLQTDLFKIQLSVAAATGTCYAGGYRGSPSCYAL
jgi:beta-mannosidase